MVMTPRAVAECRGRRTGCGGMLHTRCSEARRPAKGFGALLDEHGRRPVHGVVPLEPHLITSIDAQSRA
jgi:hypothetical protein